jgi:RNA polymerase sigma factor (sigma-70 family)
VGVADGAQDLFAEFVGLRSAALQRTAYLVAGDGAEAEDLVREALTRTYLAWPRLRDPHRAEDFARAAIAQEAVRRGRRRGARRTDSAAAAAPSMPTSPTAPAGTAPVGVEEDADDPAVRLWRGLALLTARQRAVVVLRVHDELTAREIADALGCSVRTVEREEATGLAELRRSVDPGSLAREVPR